MWMGGASALYGHMNSGDGFFGDRQVIPASVGIGIDRVRAADLDDDDLIDLVIVDGPDNPVPTLRVLWNEGGGAFSLEPIAFNGCTDVALGDLNDDDLPEVVSITPSGNVIVLWNNGLRTFSSIESIDPSSSPHEVQLVDMNDDGLIDVVTTDRFDGFGIMTNNGGGAFGPAVYLAPDPTYPELWVGPFLRSVLGDFNGDRLVDVFLTSGTDGDCTAQTQDARCDRDVNLMWNTGDGVFIEDPQVKTADSYIPSTGAAPIDIDGDLIDDILNVTDAHYGGASGEFTKEAWIWSRIATESDFGRPLIAVDRVNGDEINDIIVVSAEIPAFPELGGTRVLALDGARVVPPQIKLDPTVNLSTLVVANRDGNGRDDVLIIGSTSLYWVSPRLNGSFTAPEWAGPHDAAQTQ